MDKDEILSKSRKENEGKPDELELAALGKAARVGMYTGGLICVALILVSRWIVKQPGIALAGWIIFFAMQGSSNFVLYKHLKAREKLLSGIINTAFALIFAIALVIALLQAETGM